jgi:hypothetical protein
LRNASIVLRSAGPKAIRELHERLQLRKLLLGVEVLSEMVWVISFCCVSSSFSRLIALFRDSTILVSI